MSNIARTDDEKKAIKGFEVQINSYEESISKLLAQKGVKKDEFIVTTINAIKKNIELLNCDRATLFSAILTSAELGLMPNTPFGFSYIIPYNRSYRDENGKWQKSLEAQFQIGYQGWQEIIYRNPRVALVDTDLICENDEFEEVLGTKPIHRKKKPKERGAPEGVIAIVYLKDSDIPIYVVLWDEDLEKFKQISQGAYKTEKKGKDYVKVENENSPWNNPEKDPQRWMWRKTALKQLAKKLPKTNDIEKAYRIDNAVEMGGGSINRTEDGEFEVMENEKLIAEQKNAEQKQKGKSVQDNIKGQIGKMNGDKKEGESDYTEIDAEVKGIGVLGITEEEICNYFKIDNVHSMSQEQLSALRELHAGVSEGEPQAIKAFRPAQK